jgi:hypothetical protein
MLIRTELIDAKQAQDWFQHYALKMWIMLGKYVDFDAKRRGLEAHAIGFKHVALLSLEFWLKSPEYLRGEPLVIYSSDLTQQPERIPTEQMEGVRTKLVADLARYGITVQTT